MISPLRIVLFESQKGVCFYCKRLVTLNVWSIDHKIPVCRGGKGGSNKVGACKSCNFKKGLLTDVEFFSLKPGTGGIGERAKAAIKEYEKNNKRRWVKVEIFTWRELVAHEHKKRFGIGS